MSEEKQDPMDMDIDELGKMIDRDQVPEDEPEEPQEEPTDEIEAAEESEDEAPDEETKDEEPPPSDLDLLKLEVERLKASEQHWRMSHDRLSGQYSSLRQRMESRPRPSPTRPTDEDRYESNGESTSETRRLLEEIREERRQAKVEAASRAMQEEVAAFSTVHKDAQDYAQGMQDTWNQQYHLIQEALETGDPERARSLTRQVLNDSYYQARGVALQERIEKTKVDQAASLKDKKRAAEVSSSGGRRAAPKSKQIDPMEMDIEKLGKLIEKHIG